MNKTSVFGMALLTLSGFAVAGTGGASRESARPSSTTRAPRNSSNTAQAPSSDAAAANKPPAAAKPIDALSWVIGGVWTADAGKMEPGMRIETRYQWSDNNAYIRFNTHFVFDKGTAKTYDGNFYWDPREKHLAMWYMDAQNSITAGPVQVDGDVWTMTWRGADFAGQLADLRVTVKRKSNHDYQWTASEKEGDTWKDLASLEYLRTPEK
jgi:hypothetical protein